MNEVPLVNSGASKNKKPFPWTWIVLAFVLGVPVFFVGYIISLPVRTVREADAGFRKAKTTIDPEQLRSWALATAKSHKGTNGYSHEVIISEIPDYMKKLYSVEPEHAWADPNTGTVGIIWGGGFFHWGFYIGG